MKNLKVKLFSFFSALTILAAAVFTTPVFAHHIDNTEEVSCKNGSLVYEFAGSFVGGSSLRKVEWNVDVTVDGSKTTYSGSWEGVSSGFNLFSTSGTATTSVKATGNIKMSEKDNKGKWKVTQTINFNTNKTNNCVKDMQLNLSHIACADGKVEVHFVLLNVPDGVTPGTLTYTYGTIDPGAHTGNVWHYTANLPDGTYNIGSASVTVGNKVVNLHNPGAYAGTYDCTPDTRRTITYDVDNNCQGYSAWYSIDGGPKQVYASGVWTDPFVNEGSIGIDAFVLTPPSGEVYDVTTIPARIVTESGECQKTHQVAYDVIVDCDGYSAWYSIDGGPKQVYASGSWSNPFVGDETADIAAYDIPTNTGELYSITQVPSTTANESDADQSCQKSHIVSYGVIVDCDGYSAWYSIDGGDKQVYASGSWTDPFTTEPPVSIPAYGLTPPSGETYDITEVPATTVTESGECLQHRSNQPSVEMSCRIDESGKPVVDLFVKPGNTVIDAGDFGMISVDTLLPAVPEATYVWNWVAKEGYVGEGTITVIVKADCETPTKGVWKAVCKNNCGGERWESTRGATTWKSNDLYGSGEEGILLVWGVNDDCAVTPAGCINLTYKYVVSKESTGGFTVVDRGREFRPTVITDAYGQKWNVFVGYTITCFEDPRTSALECGTILPDIDLPNGWGKAYNMADDGWDMIPDDPDVPVYPEGPCNLAPADWMTQIVDGQAVAFKLPGVSGNDWRIYLFKKGILPWPAGWPDKPEPGAWDKHAYPLEDANAWQALLMDPTKHSWVQYIALPDPK